MCDRDCVEVMRPRASSQSQSHNRGHTQVWKKTTAWLRHNLWVRSPIVFLPRSSGGPEKWIGEHALHSALLTLERKTLSSLKWMPWSTLGWRHRAGGKATLQRRRRLHRCCVVELRAVRGPHGPRRRGTCDCHFCRTIPGNVDQD